MNNQDLTKNNPGDLISRTCKDCIHSGLCYKENDYENFPDRCGDFISNKVLEERPHGEWKETGYETGALGITYRQTQCSNCGWEHALPMWWNFCPNCGAEMERGKEE